MGEKMEITRPYCCNELKKMDVMDSAGKKIGRIDEMTFTFDGELKFSHIILAGPVWEEVLETLRLRPDRNPVFDSSAISKVDKHIHLKTTANRLSTTMDKDAIPDDEIRFSEIKKLDIIDKDDVIVGRATDVDFDVDGCASIIAGGGFIEEKLEAVGLKDDVDVIVPCDVIVSVDESIRISVSRNDLETTLDGILEEKAKEIQEARAAAKQRHDARRERVYAFWPYSSR